MRSIIFIFKKVISFPRHATWHLDEAEFFQAVFSNSPKSTDHFVTAANLGAP